MFVMSRDCQNPLELKNIPGDITPRQNQTEKVEIRIYMALNSLQDYDEITGITT
jgi:hypothetical protein